MAKQATIWLAGSYPESAHKFFRAELSKARELGPVVAVDAALALFAKLDMRPTLLLGDFDSVEPSLLKRFAEIERISYDSDKDKTDGELALRYLLDRDYQKIDIYGAIDTEFESDQMLANIFCLRFGKETGDTELRLVDHRQHIYLLEDEVKRLSGKRGNVISIMPLSDEVVISISGVRWELKKARVPFGSTWPLRNEFVESEVAISIDGRAIVVHRYA